VVVLWRRRIFLNSFRFLCARVFVTLSGYVSLLLDLPIAPPYNFFRSFLFSLFIDPPYLGGHGLCQSWFLGLPWMPLEIVFSSGVTHD